MLRQTAIWDMFARSPIRLLQCHMRKTHACIELLLPFLTALLEENFKEAKKQQIIIASLEKEADELKKEVRQHLPKSLFLPVPRGDLLELLAKQELLANRAKDIAGIMLGRNMQVPKRLAKDFLFFLRRTIDASAQAYKAISEMDELLESGFRGKAAAIVDHMIEELNRIESDTDALQIKLRHDLFTMEKELKPIDVMFLYKIIEWIGELADSAQRIGSRLQMLLIH